MTNTSPTEKLRNTKRFYIATRLLAGHAPKLLQRVTSLMQEFNWESSSNRDVVAEMLPAPADAPKAAQATVRAVARADVVIVMRPWGRETHAALGMALAYGKPVVLFDSIGEIFPPVCHFHPLVVERVWQLEKIPSACCRAIAQRDQRREGMTTRSHAAAVLLLERERLEEVAFDAQREWTLALSPEEAVESVERLKLAQQRVADLDRALALLGETEVSGA